MSPDDDTEMRALFVMALAVVVIVIVVASGFYAMDWRHY